MNHAMSTELWRWADPNGKQRRVKLDELRSALSGGLIAPNTPVWKPGWKGWRSAQEVPELNKPEKAGANGDIPPPPLAVLAVQHDFEAEAERASHAPGAPSDEPPPPPKYVPLPTKGGSVPTVTGGPAVVVTAPGKSVPPPAAQASSIPTTIGLPPPPELKALADEAARKRGKGGPPPPPKRKDNADEIEELSGSVLLDDASNLRVASSDPDEVTDLDAAGIPPRRDARWILEQLKADIGEIRAKRPPKNKGLAIAAGFFALCLLISVLAIFSSIIGAIAGSGDKPVASAAPSASAAPPAPTTVAADPPPADTAPAPKEDPKPAAVMRALGDCTTAGDAKLVAPRALISGGLEVSATANGLAVGFATSPRDGVAQWFESAAVARTRGLGDIRRVTPMMLGGRASALADVDRKGDRIQLRRAVASGSLVDLGVADNAIVWAPHGTSSLAKLFDLEGDGPVEALRAVPLSGQKGVALAFRRGGAIYAGAATGDAMLEAKGGLARIAGLGQVGSPAVAASGDAMMIAWADRAQGQEEWQVRFARMTIGEKPGDAATFALPEGGLGVQAMSPALAPLGGGRFLLAWTEGPVANHQIRAIAIGADGKASGSPMAISAPGVNAGQPQAAVSADGKGLVAFLAAKGKAYEVHATPIACAAR